MEQEPGRLRLTIMRLVFVQTFIGLAPSAWQEIIAPSEPMEPFYGVALDIIVIPWGYIIRSWFRKPVW